MELAKQVGDSWRMAKMVVILLMIDSHVAYWGAQFQFWSSNYSRFFCLLTVPFVRPFGLVGGDFLSHILMHSSAVIRYMNEFSQWFEFRSRPLA